ncbi:MAG: hypothetical protein AAB490_06645, partial [Patescibacteria group bacterium]
MTATRLCTTVTVIRASGRTVATYEDPPVGQAKSSCVYPAHPSRTQVATLKDALQERRVATLLFFITFARKPRRSVVQTLP